MKFKRTIKRLGIALAIFFVVLAAAIYIGFGRDPRCLFPQDGPIEAGLSARVVNSGGLARCYLVYAPPDHSPAEPTAVVISLHGLAGSPRGFISMTGWNEIADQEGFLVAYPHGSSFPLRWNTSPSFLIDQIDDVQFIGDVLADIQEAAAVDPARIYVNGFSQGATLMDMVACAMADKLAAVGMVEGHGDLSRRECDPARPMPVMVISGTENALGEPEDYPQWFYDLLHVSPDPAHIEDIGLQEWRDLWMASNRCAAEAIRAQPAEGLRIEEYRGCAEDAEIQLLWLEGAGHTWPGGENLAVFGETSHAISGARVLWEFFDAHQLPEAYWQP